MDSSYGPSLFTWGAEQAFYIFHPDEEGLEKLNNEAGAQYVVEVFGQKQARPVLEHLLEHGLDINSAENVSGEALTALHAAALNNNRPGVELLLAHGADPQLTDKKGRTALELAQASDKARPEQDYGDVVARLERAVTGRGDAESSRPTFSE